MLRPGRPDLGRGRVAVPEDGGARRYFDCVGKVNSFGPVAVTSIFRVHSVLNRAGRKFARRGVSTTSPASTSCGSVRFRGGSVLNAKIESRRRAMRRGDERQKHDDTRSWGVHDGFRCK